MDTKISAQFWSNRDIENVGPDIKLAALWLLTNQRVSKCGYAKVTPKFFAFETGLPAELLERTYQALPNQFLKFGDGYLMPSYIKHQFGLGGALVRSTMSTPVVRAMSLIPREATDALLRLYPELSEPFKEFHHDAHMMPMGSPPPPQEKRGDDKSGDEQRSMSGETQTERLVAREAARTLPASLESLPGFRSLWVEWVHYQGGRHLTLPPRQTFDVHLRTLTTIAEAGGITAIVASLRTAMARNLREPFVPDASPVAGASAQALQPISCTQLLPPGMDPYRGGAYSQGHSEP